MKNFLSACLVALATLSSSSALAQEPAEEEDTGSPVVSGLYGVGFAFLVPVYPLLATTATIGVSSGNEDMAWLYVPVAGPFIAAREVDVGAGIAAAWIGTGILQSIGVGFLVAGAFVDAHDDPAEESALIISPSVSPDGASLTVAMTF